MLDGSQLSLTLVPGDPTVFWPLWAPLTHVTYVDTCTWIKKKKKRGAILHFRISRQMASESLSKSSLSTWLDLASPWKNTYDLALSFQKGLSERTEKKKKNRKPYLPPAFLCASWLVSHNVTNQPPHTPAVHCLCYHSAMHLSLNHESNINPTLHKLFL